MEINTTKRQLEADGIAEDLITFLRNHEQELELKESQVYHNYPLYRDDEGGFVQSKVMVVSRRHGVIVFGTSEVSSPTAAEALLQADKELDQVFSCIYSRLIRNKELRRSRTALKFEVTSAMFAPLAVFLADDEPELEGQCATNYAAIAEIVNRSKTDEAIEESTFRELISTLEGAKGLLRPKVRHIANAGPKSKGKLVSQVESEIASFDKRQKHGYMTPLDGPERIRGLAGSGKTVVLAMKAALTHLRQPEAKILYTFHTKSLYQHVKRLITRFYRQFDDRDPDWDRISILHAWGGRNIPGVYFNTCEAYGVTPISLRDANQVASSDPFGYVCKELLRQQKIEPAYDYIFVDEGQDFSAVFIRLCTALAKGRRVVWAYDELQTIFRTAAPTPGEIFGTNQDGKPRVELAEDIVLYKCYRNPREVLVAAHALGFGLYGPRIVQMLEDREHWKDVGYHFEKGDCVEGSDVAIERPAANSPLSISSALSPGEIVQIRCHEKMSDEVEHVADSIRADLADGLRPDDILVIVVDDRHAKLYLQALASQLASTNIATNDIHTDVFGLRDFVVEGQVTLSTVHKAKGNEAFMVYVVGVDALFYAPRVRERNMLFTAMTRAKGWLRLSGMGAPAQSCAKELQIALQNFPYLRFRYPSQDEMKVMRRDLQLEAIRKQDAERKLDEILADLSPDEVTALIQQRTFKKHIDRP